MENAAQMASELSFTSVILRLALATLIGTLVGTERSSRGAERRGKDPCAGMYGGGACDADK